MWICFNCSRVGRAARYCQSRWFAPRQKDYYGHTYEGPRHFSPRRPQQPRDAANSSHRSVCLVALLRLPATRVHPRKTGRCRSWRLMLRFLPDLKDPLIILLAQQNLLGVPLSGAHVRVLIDGPQVSEMSKTSIVPLKSFDACNIMCAGRCWRHLPLLVSPSLAAVQQFCSPFWTTV